MLKLWDFRYKREKENTREQNTNFISTEMYYVLQGIHVFDGFLKLTI